MGVGGIPGPVRQNASGQYVAGQYVAGLCAAIVGLCAAGWLALAPAAFGYRSGGTGTALHRATVADWGTAAALGAVSLATLLAWVVAWRRQLRADGILTPSARRLAWREARARRRTQRRERDEVRPADVAGPAGGQPDPARVLSELRALLVPLLDEAEAVGPAAAEHAHEEPVGEEPVGEEPAPEEPVRQEPAHEEAAHEEPAHEEQPVAPGVPAVPQPRPGGLAAMESMLAGAELLMVACGEEEAW